MQIKETQELKAFFEFISLTNIYTNGESVSTGPLIESNVISAHLPDFDK